MLGSEFISSRPIEDVVKSVLFVYWCPSIRVDAIPPLPYPDVHSPISPKGNSREFFFDTFLASYPSFTSLMDFGRDENSLEAFCLARSLSLALHILRWRVMCLSCLQAISFCHASARSLSLASVSSVSRISAYASMFASMCTSLARHPSLTSKYLCLCDNVFEYATFLSFLSVHSMGCLFERTQPLSTYRRRSALSFSSSLVDSYDALRHVDQLYRSVTSLKEFVDVIEPFDDVQVDDKETLLMREAGVLALLFLPCLGSSASNFSTLEMFMSSIQFELWCGFGSSLIRYVTEQRNQQIPMLMAYTLVDAVLYFILILIAYYFAVLSMNRFLVFICVVIFTL